jgi:SAM-dependent methyltransferase
MIGWLLSILGIAIIVFGAVILFGAPYLPTMKEQIGVALELMDLPKGATMLELGSGDGRVLLAAAKRGMKVTGYELNPILVLVSYIVTWRYRKQVRIIWGNYWKSDWPQFDAIFVFLLPKYMAKLDKKIIQQTSAPCKVVSFAFKIPGKKPKAQKAGVMLYEYS